MIARILAQPMQTYFVVYRCVCIVCVVVLRFYMVSVSMNAFLLIYIVYICIQCTCSLCVQLLNKTIMLKQILADLYTYRMNVASIA